MQIHYQAFAALKLKAELFIAFVFMLCEQCQRRMNRTWTIGIILNKEISLLTLIDHDAAFAFGHVHNI